MDKISRGVTGSQPWEILFLPPLKETMDSSLSYIVRRLQLKDATNANHFFTMVPFVPLKEICSAKSRFCRHDNETYWLQSAGLQANMYSYGSFLLCYMSVTNYKELWVFGPPAGGPILFLLSLEVSGMSGTMSISISIYIYIYMSTTWQT